MGQVFRVVRWVIFALFILGAISRGTGGHKLTNQMNQYAHRMATVDALTAEAGAVRVTPTPRR